MRSIYLISLLTLIINGLQCAVINTDAYKMKILATALRGPDVSELQSALQDIDLRMIEALFDEATPHNNWQTCHDHLTQRLAQLPIVWLQGIYQLMKDPEAIESFQSKEPDLHEQQTSPADILISDLLSLPTHKVPAVYREVVHLDLAIMLKDHQRCHTLHSYVYARDTEQILLNSLMYTMKIDTFINTLRLITLPHLAPGIAEDAIKKMAQSAPGRRNIKKQVSVLQSFLNDNISKIRYDFEQAGLTSPQDHLCVIQIALCAPEENLKKLKPL